MIRIRSHFSATLFLALALGLPGVAATASTEAASFGVTVQVAAICGINAPCGDDAAIGGVATSPPAPPAFRSNDPRVSVTTLEAAPDMAAGSRIAAPSDRPVELDF